MALSAGHYGELYILPALPDTRYTAQTADSVGSACGTGPFTATQWRMMTRRRARDISPLGVAYTLFAPLPYVVHIAARGFWDGETGESGSNMQWLSRTEMYCKLYRKKSSTEYIEVYSHWMELDNAVDVNGVVLWQGVMRAQGIVGPDATNEFD